MKKNILNIITNLLIVLCLGIAVFSSYQIFSYEIGIRKSKKENEHISSIIDDTAPVDSTTTEKKWSFNKDSWNALKAQNSEFVGYLRFDSGLISEPLVLPVNNDYYLTHSFLDSYDEAGTPFVDYTDSLTDTNITVYGHYVYADTTRMFSPLTLLTKQENYQANKTFKIYWENSVDTYLVTYVYYFKVADYATYDYTQRNFASKSEFNNFIAHPQGNNEIDTEGQISYGDKFITLQTCVRYNESKRLLVLARRVSSEAYATTK